MKKGFDYRFGHSERFGKSSAFSSPTFSCWQNQNRKMWERKIRADDFSSLQLMAETAIKAIRIIRAADQDSDLNSSHTP